MKAIFVAIFITLILSPTLLAANVVVVIDSPSKKADRFIEQLQTTLNQPISSIMDLSKETPADSNRKENTVYLIIGTYALEKMLLLDLDTPSIAVYISRRSFYHATKAYRHNQLALAKPIRLDNISAVYAEPDPKLQLDIVKKLFPKRPTAAVILSDETLFLRDELMLHGAKTGVNVRTKVVISLEDLIPTLKTLSENDVLLAIPDSLVWTGRTMDSLVYAAIQNSQNVVGFSRDLVSSGSLGTVYALPKHIVQQLNIMLEQYESKKVLPNATYSTIVETILNERMISERIQREAN